FAADDPVRGVDAVSSVPRVESVHVGAAHAGANVGLDIESRGIRWGCTRAHNCGAGVEYMYVACCIVFDDIIVGDDQSSIELTAAASRRAGTAAASSSQGFRWMPGESPAASVPGRTPSNSSSAAALPGVDSLRRFFAAV